MDGGKHVVAHQALAQHNGILIIVSLPRHVSHQQVTTKSQLSILGCIAFGEDVASLHALSLLTDRTQVDGHVLVRAAELRDAIFLQSRLKADKLLIRCAVVENADSRSIDILNDTIALSHNHRARVFTNLLLQTGTHDRSIVVKQRHSLTHHVTSHQCTVTVIVLQERNQTSRHRGNLLRRHVHEVNLRRSNHGEVGVLTTLHISANERTVLLQRGIALTDDVLSLFFSSQVDHILVLEINHAVVHLAIRSFNEAKLVDGCIDAKRRNQTDVRAFRALNRA